jgi:hypothetical protein
MISGKQHPVALSLTHAMRPKLAPPSVDEHAGQSQNMHQASLNFLVNQQQNVVFTNPLRT